VSHLRHLNAANAQANPARRRRHDLCAQRRHHENRVSRRRAGSAKARRQAPLVALRTIHRVAAEELNAKDSALLRQRVREETSAAALNREHRPKHATLAVSRRLVVLQVKRAGQEKEARALGLNLAGSHREVEHKLRASSAVRGNQRSALPISRNAQAKNRREEHHRQVHNNAGVVFTAAPKQNLRSRFLLVNAFL
jgi:hypothetical protein